MFYHSIFLLLLLGCLPLHAMNDDQPSKIVVIGAGLSGLTTAYRLDQMGFNVEVYEARNRVGGRVFTVKLGGEPAELGGQNILDGGKAEHILSLIEELNLEVEQSKIARRIKYFQGDEIIDPQTIFKEKSLTKDEIQEVLNKAALSANNMDDVLQALFKEDEILYRFFHTTLAAYEGAPAEKLSPIYIETLYHMLLGGLSVAHPSEGQEEIYIHFQWVKGGNGLIAEKMAAKLSPKVHLNAPLRAISKTGSNSFLLTFASGEQIYADIVVLSIPCSVYEDIEFGKDVISTDHLSKIQSVQYGTNSKILIPLLPNPSAIGSYTNGRMISFFPGTMDMATLYYVGDSGRFTEETIEETFQHDLPFIKRAYTLTSIDEKPKMAKDQAFITYKGPVGHCWPNDPFAKGSYSYIASGQEKMLITFEKYAGETVKSLFAPIDQSFFFAGEHTSILQEVIGTMEAAVESGERTARLIQKIKFDNIPKKS